jgi:serine/threonine protein kinase
MSFAQQRQLPVSESQESLLRNFNADWDEDRLADYASRIPRDAPWRLTALHELVKIDLRRQWEKGNRRLLESYLISYPELGTVETVALDLIQAEMQARRRTGDPITALDLAQRFPRPMGRLQRSVEHVCADPAPGEPTSQTLLPTSLTQQPPAPPPPQAKPNLNVPAKDTPPDASIAASSTLTPEESAPDINLPPGEVKKAKGPKKGRYELLKELGRGAMGTVYLAYDTDLERQVAMKIPHFQPGDSPDLRTRFMREARAAAKLQHPNICQVYDVGEEDGRPYLTMAYLEGETLHDKLRGSKGMPQRNAVEVIAKLARALEEAHRHGVVHRDLKPANVMIKRRGEPVIMDFGLARRNEDASITHQGSVLGTPAYMSPEQVNGEVKLIGPASDQYALGVILYELLTGQVPFKGTIGQVMAKILMETPKLPSELRPDLDPAVEETCLRAMARDISHRFASVGDFAEALEHFLTPTRTDPDINPDAPRRPASSPEPDGGSDPGFGSKVPPGSNPPSTGRSNRSARTDPKLHVPAPKTDPTMGDRPVKTDPNFEVDGPAQEGDLVATLLPGISPKVSPAPPKPSEPEVKPAAVTPEPTPGWKKTSAKTPPAKTPPAKPAPQVTTTPGTPGPSRKPLVVAAILLGLAIGGGVAAYFLVLNPPEPAERFRARIENLSAQERFKEALEQIQEAKNQDEQVKANVLRRVRNDAVPWAEKQLDNKQDPDKVREVLDLLLPHFRGEARLAELRARANALEIQAQVATLIGQKRYKDALDLLRQGGPDIAELPWAREEKDRILREWTDGAAALLKAKQFKKAQELAQVILDTEKGYQYAEQVRAQADFQRKTITAEVTSQLNKKAFEGAYDQLAKDWPSDEDQLKDEILKQWLAAVEQYRKGNQLSQLKKADAALVAMAKRYDQDGHKVAINELKREVARDRVRLPVNLALKAKTWPPLQEAADALTSKDATSLDLAERKTLREQLERVWITLSKQEKEPQAQVVHLRNLPLPLQSKATQVAIADIIGGQGAAAQINAALHLQELTKSAFAKSRADLQALQGKSLNAKDRKRIEGLLVLLDRAQKGAEQPLSDAVEAFETSLSKSADLVREDRDALEPIPGRLYALRVQQSIPKPAEDVKAWEKRLEDCNKVKQDPDTWVLACRVECLAELDQVADAEWRTALGALREHLEKGRQLPEAEAYALYVNALALWKSAASADAAKVVTEELGKKDVPAALQAAHRKDMAVKILVAAVDQLRAKQASNFREPFGPTPGADTAFPWLELAYRLAGPTAEDSLRQELVLAAWYKTARDSKLAGAIVPELVSKEALKNLTTADAVRFALIHAKTREGTAAARKTALTSYQLALAKVESLLRTSSGPSAPAGFKEDVVLPVCEAFSTEVIEPLCAKNAQEQFLGTEPDTQVQDQVARLCARLSEVIRADLPIWTELKRLGKNPLEKVVTLYDRAYTLANPVEEKAEYLVAKAYTYHALPNPPLKKLQEYAATATEIAPKYPGGYGLKGVNLIHEARSLPDYKDKERLLRQADDELAVGLKLHDKLQGDKKRQLSALLYDSLGSVCLELGNYVAAKSEKEAYLRRGAKYLKDLLDHIDPRNGEARRTYALLLEDIGLYVAKTGAETADYYRRACAELSKVMDKQNLSAGRTKPWLDRGRIQVRWAGLGGPERAKLLKAAAKDFEQVSNFSAEALDMTEAYRWQANVAILGKDAERAATFFTQGLRLARKAKTEVWEEEILKEWCTFAWEEAKARLKNATVSKKYADMCEARARDLEKFSKAAAAWFFFNTRQLKDYLNSRPADPEALLTLLGRGLEGGRLQDRTTQFYLRAERARIYLDRTDPTTKAKTHVPQAYKEALAALKLSEQVTVPDEAKALPMAVAGLACLEYKDAYKYFPETVDRLREAVTLGPNHPQSWLWRGILAVTLANEKYKADGVTPAQLWEEAARNSAEAYDRVPPSVEGARNYFRGKRKEIEDQALPVLQNAVKANGKAADAWKWRWRIAEILYHQDDRAGARTYLGQVEVPAGAAPAHRTRVAELRKLLEGQE